MHTKAELWGQQAHPTLQKCEIKLLENMQPRQTDVQPLGKDKRAKLSHNLHIVFGFKEISVTKH